MLDVESGCVAKEYNAVYMPFSQKHDYNALRHGQNQTWKMEM